MAKQAFELPEDQCERLTRNEMASLRLVLVLASEVTYAKEDLSRRLGIVPNGKSRMNMVLGGINSLFKDLLGTVSDKQRKALRNSALDYEIRLVPKMTPESSSIAVQKQDMTEMIDCAREKCKFCTLDGEECRKCKLYKLLETIVPLDDYNSDIACPYAFEDWGG